MPHPIYGDPKHELDTVHFVLWLPRPSRELPARCQALGRSETSRSALWTVDIDWEDGGDQHGYHAGDFLSHVAMVALQDHPTSQRQVDACMVGEGWAQDELPM